MSWSMLANGVCPPAPGEPFRFVKSASGSENHALLDNRGRIFTWGTASYTYTGQTPVPAGANYAVPIYFENPGVNGWQIQYPYQVGTKDDYVDVQLSARTFYGLDSDNHLYAWGEGDDGQGGWTSTSQYNAVAYSGVSGAMTPGGSVALFPTLVSNLQWKAFAAGPYHVLGLGQDNRVYVWGTNGNSAFGMPTPTSSLTPLLVTTLPNVDFKFISAGYNGSLAVTANNVIYLWGRTDYQIYTTPTVITLTIPAGETIVQVKHGGGGIAILLSNGALYCTYNRLNFTAVDATLALIPGSHFFTHVDTFETGIVAIDDAGNLWGWGNQAYVVSRNDAFCDQDVLGAGQQPVLITTGTLNSRVWQYATVGGACHVAVDNQGRAFTWGFNNYGLLGIGQSSSELDHSCAIQQVVTPTLDNGTLAYDEQTGTGAIITHIQILPQLSAHDPCGHWHKGGGDTARRDEEFAANCWEPTIATDGTDVLYVICGRHRPNEIYLLLYNIATNKWSTIMKQQDILHSNWDGGAAIDGNVYAFHNYAYDISGEQYQEVTSNPRMRTYVQSGATMRIKEWPSTVELHGRNKIAVTSTGSVACIIRTASAWQVHGSSNAGTTYSLLYTLPGTVTDAAVLFGPDDGLVYVAVIDTAADALRIYSGTIAGTGWVLKSTTAIADPTSFRFHVDGSRFFAAIGNKFFYSTNNCTSFTQRDLHESSIHFAATGKLLYNLAELIDYRTTDYEAASINWSPITQFGTSVDRCTIHNRGQLTVYSQATMRTEASKGQVVSILLSHNLGERWSEISTPLDYYETFEQTLNLGDDPRWPFVPQWAKL